jgi:replicative DNA helicase
MSEELGDTGFAVTQEYQAKVLAYMLQNPDFCDIASTNLKPEYFNDRSLQWFFSTLTESEHKLTATTLQEELFQAVRGKTIREEEIGKYASLYDIVKERVIPSEEAYIKDKVDVFVRTQAVKNALVEGVGLAKESKWDDLVGVMQDAVASGVNLQDAGYDYLGTVEDRVFDRATHRALRKIPTGIPELDALTYGGIKNGQMGMIVGGTGRGKSIFLQWLARTALLLNKKVVYFTFELGVDDISDRFDSMFSIVKPQELNDYQAEVIEKISDLNNTYGKSLIIQHYPADTATINTLKDFCRRLSQSGIVPDLIIIDYLDLMRPHRTYGDVHAEIDAITKGIVGFAAEFDTSVWTATQLNRAGMVADTPDEAGMAGYIGKQYHADMVLWMAQTKEEKEDEQMRLWISKNRNGRIGTVTLDTDYSYMTFYSEAKIAEDAEPEEETPQEEAVTHHSSLAAALLADLKKEDDE